MAIKKSKQVEAHMSKLDEVKIFFDVLKEQRQESFDNKSEKWQEGEKGEEEQENLNALEEIADNLQSVYDEIDNLFEE